MFDALFKLLWQFNFIFLKVLVYISVAELQNELIRFFEKIELGTDSNSEQCQLQLYITFMCQNQLESN